MTAIGSTVYALGFPRTTLVSNGRGRALADLDPPPRPGPIAIDVFAR